MLKLCFAIIYRILFFQFSGDTLTKPRSSDYIKKGIEIRSPFFMLDLENKLNLKFRNYCAAQFQITNSIYNAPLIIESTTPGSNNVDVSPKLVVSPSATLRKIRRMILPERVLGRPVTN